MPGKRRRRNGLAIMMFASLAMMMFAPLAMITTAASAYAFNGEPDDTGRSSGQPGYKKYLLAVGIAAYPQSPLAGCVNDATSMMSLLTRDFDFDAGASRLLIDSEATRANIIGGIERYIALTAKGDLFVLFYSGHGSLFPDDRSLVQDETETLNLSYLRARSPSFRAPDGRYDSALAPVDAFTQNAERQWGNLILDDELFVLFSKMTAKGVNVILISDSCHSGTLTKSLDPEGTPKLLDPETVLGVKLNAMPAPKNIDKIDARQMNGLYLSFTSSQDNQISLDLPRLKQGLFTGALVQAILSKSATERKSLTYKELYDACKYSVEQGSQRTQTPKLDNRYYSRSLDEPLFASPVIQSAVIQAAQPAPAALRRMKVYFAARGRGGEAIPNSSLALFRPEIQSVLPRQPITVDQTLLILRTDGAGEAAGEAALTVPGEYWIKVVCVGYRSEIQRVRLVEDPRQRGSVKLSVVLNPE